MQTWVRAMGGKTPIAILTDQNKAMKVVMHWDRFSKLKASFFFVAYIKKDTIKAWKCDKRKWKFYENIQ